VSPQEGEEGQSIAEILQAARSPGMAGGQFLRVAQSKTVAQPRTLAEIVRYRREIQLAQEVGASGERGRIAEQA
jgi:hypothetical protein